jgi:CelD/BcsL family acetyltransferase involved in cellulose biosynthesis
MELKRVDLDAFTQLSAGLEVTVSQTPAWLRFLAVSQGAEPVLAEVLDGGQTVGLFTGALVRKASFKILGSPLRGWTSSYMGLALRDGIDHAAALEALRRFAFGGLGAAHLEVLDRNARQADYSSAWQGRILEGFEIDLTRTEEQLFAAMDSACRRCIRKAEKVGLTIEEATDGAAFAAEYYTQLGDVFAKQNLVPTYSRQRVEQLIAALQPEGMLLLLRALDAEGRCIGTSIFPGHGPMMYFWGGASWREHQHNRPNEAMLWYAMRYWQARGVRRFDMGGGGSYKEKYGGERIAVPWMRVSRSKVVAGLRVGAERVLRLRQQLLGRGKR